MQLKNRDVVIPVVQNGVIALFLLCVHGKLFKHISGN